jgi:ABC-type cobalamin transport system permease subunit
MSTECQPRMYTMTKTFKHHKWSEWIMGSFSGVNWHQCERCGAIEWDE